MIKFIVLSALLNAEDSNIYATLPSDPIKVEAGRRRGKGRRDNIRRGGGGLR
tara:strand:+ start:417 stop:572 length:156 start_codon:yes stop_codon:yes gene_type:complete